MSKICVEAVMSVADLEHRDVNFDMIKVCVIHNTHLQEWSKLKAAADMYTSQANRINAACLVIPWIKLEQRCSTKLTFPCY